MAGLRGQIREPRESARARRNSQNLASEVQFTDPNSAIRIGDDGKFFLDLANVGGLEEDTAQLQIKLDTDPGLALSGDGLTAVVASPLTLGASGIGLSIGDGLTDNAGTLEADLGNGLTITSGSIEVNAGAGLSLGATVAVDINGQTEDASPDGAADYVLSYDDSAGGLKKVLMDNLPGGGGSSSPTTTKGDLEVYDGSALDRLPVGSDDDVLTADSSTTLGVKWASPASGSSPTTTKGDIEVYNGTSLVRLPVGSDDQVLTADSSAAEGVSWQDASGGGGTSFSTYADRVTHLHGVAGYWRCNEQSGTTAADSSGNGNDGTINGSPTLGVDGPIINDSTSRGIRFSGSTSEYVEIGTPSEMDLDPSSDDFTFMIWIKPDTNGVDKTWFGKGDGTSTTDRDWLLQSEQNEQPVAYILADTTSDPGGLYLTGFDVDDDAWHHLAVRIRGSLFYSEQRVQVFIDGEEAEKYGGTSADNYGGLTYGNYSLRIGLGKDGGEPADGDVSEAVVFDRALSLAEIRWLATPTVEGV